MRFASVIVSVVVAVNLGAPLSVLADGATRDLPDYYCRAVTLTVTIAVEAEPGTVVVVLEDSPPTGWTAISNISDDGEYDALHHEVRWLFFDDLSRTLAYDVTPPGDATGGQCFEGGVSFDGNPVESTGGDQCFGSSCPVPSISRLGLCTMALLGLTVGTVVFRRQRRAV